MRKIVFSVLILALLLFTGTVWAEEKASSPTINLTYTLICDPKPTAKFSWNAVSGANVYRLFTSRGNITTAQDVASTTATVGVATEGDSKYQVDALEKQNGVVVRELGYSQELFIKIADVRSKCPGLENGEDSENKDDDSEAFRKEITKENGQNEEKEDLEERDVDLKKDLKKVESEQETLEKEDTTGLEQKVQNLENELAKTKERQNVLEQIVTNLLNFIRSIFGQR